MSRSCSTLRCSLRIALRTGLPAFCLLSNSLDARFHARRTCFPRSVCMFFMIGSGLTVSSSSQDSGMSSYRWPHTQGQPPQLLCNKFQSLSWISTVPPCPKSASWSWYHQCWWFLFWNPHRWLWCESLCILRSCNAKECWSCPLLSPQWWRSWQGNRIFIISDVCPCEFWDFLNFRILYLFFLFLIFIWSAKP